MSSVGTFTPMIDTRMGYQYRQTSREAICLGIATAVHALVFLWNPIIMKTDFEKTLNPLVEIGIVEETAAAPAPEPKKMSLMDTLKDMLSKPAPAPSHVEPKPQQPPTPLLQERVMPHLITNTLKTPSPDELAMAKNPTPITSAQKTFQLPNASPTLQTKSFGGIRSKDLPFETSNESIATPGQAVPILVGNAHSKAALSYTNPALTNNNRANLQSKKFFGSATNEPVLKSAAAPIQMGGNPTSIAPTNTAPALRESQSTGGGLINKALLGNHTSSVATIQTMPSAAAQLDQQLTDTTPSRVKKSPNGFDIVGRLANRTILKKIIPQYPSWAEEQGIIGTLRLYFTVTPEGAVRSNIKVTKTTGNPQLDQIGVDALKQWLFAPQPPTSEEDVQWGIITFTFSLAS